MQQFGFHPVVARWFEQKFGTPTEPQERGWPAIQSGAHTLIAAPTGSGKTLAAFLASLDALFREGLKSLLAAGEFDIVAEAANGQDAIKEARRLRPDVAIVDISMPGLNGVDAAR